MFHDLMRRRMSYDIDNIVIPYRFTEFYWVLPSFNLVLLGVTGFYLVSLGFT